MGTSQKRTMENYSSLRRAIGNIRSFNNPGPFGRSNPRQQQQTTIAEYYSTDAGASTRRRSPSGGRNTRARGSSAVGRNVTSNSIPTFSIEDDLFDDVDMHDMSDAPNSSNVAFEAPSTSMQPGMMVRRGTSFFRGRGNTNNKPSQIQNQYRLPSPSQMKRPATNAKNWSAPSFEENLADDDFDNYEWDEAPTPRKMGYFGGANQGGTAKKEISKYPTYDNKCCKPKLVSPYGNFPRAFTVSVSKLQNLVKNNSRLPGQAIYQVFGILGSDARESPSGAKCFSLKDQKKGAVKCKFYEMDRPMKTGNKGEWQRCVGFLKKDGCLQCLNLRRATDEELLELDTMLCASSREVALVLRSK